MEKRNGIKKEGCKAVDGESFDELIDRVRNVLYDIIKNTTGEIILEADISHLN